MADRLALVIGATGVNALFRRALHLTSKTYPWLALAGDHGNAPDFLNSLKARFEICDAAVAMEAGTALLVTFTELLAGLLGDPLTERLLSPIWLSPQPKSKHEASPCSTKSP